MPVELKINNVVKTVDVEPDTPLLWVLRDTLNLHGTKLWLRDGALRGMHRDGRRPGRTLLSDAGFQRRRQAGYHHRRPLPRRLPSRPDGLEKIDVPQCGYCQAGQIMSASALLARTPHPTDADIDAAMSGNLCRCGTYPRIRQAIHEAATMQKA